MHTSAPVILSLQNQDWGTQLSVSANSSPKNDSNQDAILPMTLFLFVWKLNVLIALSEINEFLDWIGDTPSSTLNGIRHAQQRMVFAVLRLKKGYIQLSLRRTILGQALSVRLRGSQLKWVKEGRDQLSVPVLATFPDYRDLTFLKSDWEQTLGVRLLGVFVRGFCNIILVFLFSWALLD